MIGCAGESKLSPERIEGFTEQMKKFGVPLVDKPADMIGKVDGMLIESVDGTVHLERATPFLEAGIPCFIDKPFTCSVADAKKIIELAERKKSRRLLVVLACGTRRRSSSTWPTRSRASSSAARSTALCRSRRSRSGTRASSTTASTASRCSTRSWVRAASA